MVLVIFPQKINPKNDPKIGAYFLARLMLIFGMSAAAPILCHNDKTDKQLSMSK